MHSRAMLRYTGPILAACVALAGLRPIPTKRVMIGFRCQRKLTQGPAVELADRRHSLRRCMVTVTRSA